MKRFKQCSKIAKKKPGTEDFTGELYEILKKNTHKKTTLIPFFLKVSPHTHTKKKRIVFKETLSKTFYEARITLIPKSDKDITRKRNYTPIPFMNIPKILRILVADTKILPKILANRIQMEPWIFPRIAKVAHHSKINQ